MNIAVIFAGGSGARMHTTSRPKQFLELSGKPILIYTLELFESHPEIDAIVVACIESWIPYLRKMIRKYDIGKVVRIVPGGKTGQESIYNALCAAEEYVVEKNDLESTIVLIHDGVRPLINAQTISKCITTTKENSNCITCVPATESFIVKQDCGTFEIPSRDNSLVVRAPQCFMLYEIIKAHRDARENNLKFIDSCSLMTYYGYGVHTIIGPMENIKITTPEDFYVFRALMEVRENQQIFGM